MLVHAWIANLRRAFDAATSRETLKNLEKSAKLEEMEKVT